MAGTRTKLEEYLEEQNRKYRGVSMPVKAGMFERVLVKKMSCERLHPNPADEFCLAEVGPNYHIITEYEKKYRKAEIYDLDPFEEPLMVEKMHPDGYMILNGHHRWAAAMNCGVKKVPVKIVNLTQETDIHKVLENSRHDRRVSFDLDEVVLGGKEDDALEKSLGLPMKYFYRERIRLGIPALFHFLSVHGYDIWLYTGDYYSFDHIQNLFKRYHAHVDGVITGTDRKVEQTPENLEKEKRQNRMIADHYRETITVDNEMVLRTFRGSMDYEQYDLEGGLSDWSRNVLTILEQIERERV